jgi:hypothetical protein
MRVFAVLVIFEDLHLQHVRHQRVPVCAAAGSLEGHFLPAHRAIECEVRKLYQVVFARPGLEDDAGRRVGLVFREVDIEAQIADADTLDEVYCELVRLGPIRSEKFSCEGMLSSLVQGGVDLLPVLTEVVAP